jgi:adenine-specific DNA-methyltransferase
MMYPRLRLLREFLTNDGVILCSIDDNEAAHTRLLFNDIFGTRNFIAQLVWEKGRKNDAKLFSIGHDYIFVFAKNISALKDVEWRAPKDGIVEIATEYHRLRIEFKNDYDAISKGLSHFYAGLPKDHPSKKYARAKNADERGVWRDNNISWHGGGGPKYDILHPVTGKPCKVPDDGWRFVEDTMREKIAHGFVVFREDHTKPPIYKSYIYMKDESPSADDVLDNEGQREVLGSVFYRHTQPSNDVIRNIFGGKSFPNPKDHEILARLIRYVTKDSKDCIILDSFAGSGSTGHAVIDLNIADGGQRRFVLIEMDKNIASDITSFRLEKVVRDQLNTQHGEAAELVLATNLIRQVLPGLCSTVERRACCRGGVQRCGPVEGRRSRSIDR